MELKWMRIDRSKLIKSENLKLQDEQKKYKFKQFVETFGVLKNLIVIKQGDKFKIIDGNLLFEVATNEQDFICLCVENVEEDFLRVMLNTLFFKNDLVELTYLINNLNNDQLNQTPFEQDMIETFKELLTFNWNQYHETQADKNQMNMFES